MACSWTASMLTYTNLAADVTAYIYESYSKEYGESLGTPLRMDRLSRDLFACPGMGAPGVPPRLCTSTGINGIMLNDQDTFTQGFKVPDT
jgi:hypothetical protein